jgi:hypothetical protein
VEVTYEVRQTEGTCRNDVKVVLQLDILLVVVGQKIGRKNVNGRKDNSNEHWR